MLTSLHCLHHRQIILKNIHIYFFSKISELEEKNSILFLKHGLLFNNIQEEITMNFNITDGGRKNNKNNEKNENKNLINDNKNNSNFFTPVSVPPKIWRLLKSNTSAVYLHILVIKTSTNIQKFVNIEKTKVKKSEHINEEVDLEKLIQNVNENEKCLVNLPCFDIKQLEYDDVTSTLIRSGKALYDVINMVKYDRIPKSFKHRYLLSDFGFVDIGENDRNNAAMLSNTIISYWKPEIAVRLVTDFSIYPINYIPNYISQNTVIDKDNNGNKQLEYKPPIHSDEIGLTSDKYIPLNASLSWLPLKVSYAPMSLQRYQLMQNMEESLQQQVGIGFSEKDVDDVRRLISDTSIYLLTATLIASLLHLLFEILAFQSDITFWQQNKSLAGLSVRSVVCEVFSQTIVFLFLVDSDTSLLVTIPAFFGILIQVCVY